MKININEIIREIWFIKPFIKKDLCPSCKKEKFNPEYQGLCWNCYFKIIKGGNKR